MKYDVAVIGLGIVGASAVYAAAWAGARVLALDAGTPGGGTSGSSFAWLNSGTTWPLTKISRRALWPPRR